MYQYEQQIIGNLLNSVGLMYCDVLQADDFVFYRKTFVAIQKAVRENRPVNPIDIAKQSEFSLPDLLKLVTESMPSMFEDNVEQLKKCTAKRKLEKLIKNVDLNRDVAETMADLLGGLQNIDVYASQKSVTTQEAFFKYIDELDEREKNKGKELYIDIPKFNKLSAGFHRKEMTIVGARPGVGKSVFALQVAVALAKRKKKVLYVSLEMADVQLIGRLVTRFSKVDHDKLRRGDLGREDWDAIRLAMADFEESPFTIDTSIRTVGQLRAKIISMQPDIVILDYLQLFSDDTSHKDRYAEVTSISRKMKLMTLDFNIPIVALCQLNRDAEGKQPTLKDLRESGSLEQDADNVIFLHRLTAKQAETEGYGGFELCKTMIDNGRHPTQIIMEKQRDGKTGIIRSIFTEKDMVLKEFVT